MPPPAGLPPWPTPSTTRLATPTPTRPPPRTTHVRPPPPPYTRVRLPPPPPATTPLPPRLEPAAPKPAAVATLLPPSTASAASSSSTCLDCVHFGKCVSRSAETRTQTHRERGSSRACDRTNFMFDQFVGAQGARTRWTSTSRRCCRRWRISSRDTGSEISPSAGAGWYVHPI